MNREKCQRQQSRKGKLKLLEDESSCRHDLILLLCLVCVRLSPCVTSPQTCASRKQTCPNKSSDAGSGVGVVSVLSRRRSRMAGLELATRSLSQSSQSFMNTNGTAARNKNGHFGKAPPAMRISPQSQIVPSTSPSSMISTPSGCPSEVTVIPGDNRLGFGCRLVGSWCSLSWSTLLSTGFRQPDPGR